jgi:hypothetical protein
MTMQHVRESGSVTPSERGESGVIVWDGHGELLVWPLAR